MFYVIVDCVQNAWNEVVLFSIGSAFDKLKRFGEHSINILLNHSNILRKLSCKTIVVETPVANYTLEMGKYAVNPSDYTLKRNS